MFMFTKMHTTHDPKITKSMHPKKYLVITDFQNGTRLFSRKLGRKKKTHNPGRMMINIRVLTAAECFMNALRELYINTAKATYTTHEILIHISITN